MVKDYQTLPEVESIVFGGSASAKNADNHSDFDIYIYSDKEPDVEQRRKIALKYSINPEVDNHNFGTGDAYRLKETGKPIDIMYWSLQFIEDNIKYVWEEGNASLGYTTCFIKTVNSSEILYDKNGKFEQLQKRTQTPYPDKLANNIIKKNFNYLKDAMYSFYDQLESAVQREDYVSINHRSAAFLASYFDIIFAKNKILHPGEKRLVEIAKNTCKILPENFEKDVTTFAVGGVEYKLAAANILIKNLKEIL